MRVHVVIKECYQYSHVCHRQQCPHRVARSNVEQGNHRESHDGQSRRQSVYAVNEVHGVSDIYREQHRDGHAYPERYLVDEAHILQVAYPQSAHAGQCGRQYLDYELDAVAYSVQVVIQAYDIEHHHTAQIGHKGLHHCPLPQPLGVYVKPQHQHYYRGYGDDDDRQEHHSPQSGYGQFVNLPAVG